MILKIAEVVGRSPKWLESEVDEGASGLMVIGRVAGGVWKEGSVSFKPYSRPVAADPNYPVEAQRLYQVDGQSVNRVARDGQYLHAVDIHVAGIEPKHGNLVVVRRMAHGLAEYTAKVLISHDGGWILRPRSDDPDWQEDIPVGGDDGTEVEITDVVIAVWSPIAMNLA